MKIFLAGATGAVGRLLLPLLIGAGHEVTGMTRSAARRDQILVTGAQPWIADALDRQAMFAALSAVRPDVVIHQLTDLGSRNFAGNSRLRIEGTHNLVDAALAVSVPHMIAQSIAWIYIPGDGPATEDEPLDLAAPPPRENTVAAVQSLENAVAEMSIGTVLRYGILYGPGTWYASDGLITDQIRRGEIEATNGVTSFLHVADAAQTALSALSWPTGVLNIVDDEPAAGTEWLPMYASLVGAPTPAIKTGAPGWERGASNARARQLGWRPLYSTWRTGFRTALR